VEEVLALVMVMIMVSVLVIMVVLGMEWKRSVVGG
jgi:hypothetical protein